MMTGLTRASLRRCSTTVSVTPKRAAISAAVHAALDQRKESSNSSAGCICSRTAFSTRLISVGFASASMTWQMNGKVGCDGAVPRQQGKRRQPSLSRDNGEFALLAGANHKRLQQSVRGNRCREFRDALVGGGLADIAVPRGELVQGDMGDGISHSKSLLLWFGGFRLRVPAAPALARREASADGS